ncbi:MAG TPA: WG repeat-containing protein [Paludibacteraceae bacterium]|nr:WG repeat-containing protein [Paludibacteraceae bacterium]
MITPFFNKEIRPQLIRLINEAKYEIVASVSWFTDKAIYDALSHAISRSIKLSLIIQDDIINQTAPFNLEELAQAGARIYLWNTALLGTMHHKFIVVDSAKVMTGSYNWTNAANFQNREDANLIIGEDKLCEKYLFEYRQMSELVENSLLSPGIDLRSNGINEFGKFDQKFITDNNDSLNENISNFSDYSEIGDFYYGLAKVERNYKYGFIDNNGKEIIPLVYDSASDFKNGAAVVMKCDTYYFKDANHEFMLKYSGYGSRNGIKYYQVDSKYALIDIHGNELTGFIYDAIYPDLNGFYKVEIGRQFGIISSEGQEIVPPVYHWIYDLEEGFSRVMIDRKYGLFDENWNLIAPAKYDNEDFLFENGLSEVKSDKKVALIDKLGNQIIPFKYANDHYHFYCGLALVNFNDKFGYINNSGEEVIPVIYEDASHFEEDIAKVKFNGKYGFINSKGEVAIPIIYDNSDIYFHNNLAKVILGQKSGFIDKKGKVAIPLLYDEVWSFNDGLARVRIGKYVGFIDTNGSEVIPVIYENLDIDFPVTLSKVMRNGLWGFIDTKAKEVISLKYDKVSSFSEGLAIVYRDGICKLIDENECIVNSNLPLYDIGELKFSENLARVKLNEKFGYINKTGQQIISPLFDKANHFVGGLAIVSISDKYGYIDSVGNTFIECKWTEDEICRVRVTGFDNFPLGMEDFDTSRLFLIESCLNYKRGYPYWILSDENNNKRYINFRKLCSLADKESDSEILVNNEYRSALIGELCSINWDMVLGCNQGTLYIA